MTAILGERDLTMPIPVGVQEVKLVRMLPDPFDAPGVSDGLVGVQLGDGIYHVHIATEMALAVLRHVADNPELIAGHNRRLLELRGEVA